MCRVPLPEFGTTITERITALNYQDKLNQPEVVRITLANNVEDVTRIIADNIKATSRGGRGAVRTSKEDHAWFEDTNDHVAMVAEGIVGVDAEGNPNWTLLSEIIVDGTGIHQNVVEVQNGLTLAETHIEQNSRAITLEAKRASEAEGALSSSIQVTADAITAEVTRATEAEGTLSSSIQVTADAITAEVTRATGAESGLSSSITAEAGRINLVVEGTGANAKIKAASIAASINDQTGESIVSIAANRVIIDGTTKISDCFTVDANGYLHVAKRTDFAGNVVIGEQGALVLQGQSQEQYSISASSLRNYVKKAAVDSTTNTLQIWNFGDPDNAPSINFSKAAQATLDDTLAWNSGTSRGQGVYCQFTYQTVDSGGARVESDSHFATLDKSRHCVRFWEQYNSGTDTFMVNEYTFDCDPFVSEIKISHSENTTDRSKISGKTSLDFRQSIKDAIDNRQYCIIKATNEGAAENKYFYFDFT